MLRVGDGLKPYNSFIVYRPEQSAIAAARLPNMPARDAPILKAEGIAVFRGERLVLSGVDFSVAGGGALLLLGANGSGKSTLLRVVAGLTRPEAGSLTWDGQDALSDSSAHAARLAYLGHQDAVKPGLTAAENLALAARMSGDDPQAALELVGLGDLADLPGRMLSAGQKRRLAIARLSLSRAALWLLDEPTLGLDTASVDRFGGLLERHLSNGGMVIAATHLPLPMAADTLRLS